MGDLDLEEQKEKVGNSKRTVKGMEIEKGKVAEFANAINNENPVYRDEEAAREAGHPAIPAPPTFLMIKGFPRNRREGIPEGMPFEMGFDLERVLHGEQEFEFERPVYVGDTLSGEATLTDVYQRDGGQGGTMTFAIVETEYRNQDDELVAIDRATIIEQGGGGDE
jgi:acyl dehydratase